MNNFYQNHSKTNPKAFLKHSDFGMDYVCKYKKNINKNTSVDFLLTNDFDKTEIISMITKKMNPKSTVSMLNDGS